jgi:hypothetical protein
VAELVAGFEQSALSQAEYCREHGLSFATLKRYSKNKVYAAGGRRVQAGCLAPAVSLIPVELVDRPTVQESSQTALFVELPGGRRIGVGTGFDTATLRRLMMALGEV